MTLHRTLTWQTDLVRWADSIAAKPFEWGKTNCVALALTAIDIQLPAPHFMPAYRGFMRTKQRAAVWQNRYDSRHIATLFTLAGGVEKSASSLLDGDILLAQRGRNIYGHVRISDCWLSSTEQDGVRWVKDVQLDLTDMTYLTYLGIPLCQQQ